MAPMRRDIAVTKLRALGQAELARKRFGGELPESILAEAR
jgi:hypothetical protein